MSYGAGWSGGDGDYGDDCGDGEVRQQRRQRRT